MTNLLEMSDRKKLSNTLSLLEAQRSLLQKLSNTKEPVPFDFIKFWEFVKRQYPEYYDNVITLVWKRLKECSNSLSSNADNALKNNSLESIVLSSDEDATYTVLISDDDSDHTRKYSHSVSSPISKFKFSQFTELESKYSIIRVEHDDSDNDTIESKESSLNKQFGQKLNKKKKSSKEDIRNHKLKKSSQHEMNKRKNKSVEDEKTLTTTSKTNKIRETKDRKCKRIKEDKFKITDQMAVKKKKSAKSELIYNANCDEAKKKKHKTIKEKNINKKIKKCRKKILTQMDIEKLRNQLLLDKIIEMNLMQ